MSGAWQNIMIGAGEEEAQMYEHKALSIRQPYANRIIEGFKKVEIRSWTTKYRGEIIICSTRKPILKSYLCGFALGSVILDHITEDDFNFNWHLISPMPFEQPFEVTGSLGLFTLCIPMKL